MAITRIVNIGGTKMIRCPDGIDKPVAEINCLAKDMEELRALEGVENATGAWIMDWNELTDDEKAAYNCTSAYYLYDAEGKRWLPQ